MELVIHRDKLESSTERRMREGERTGGGKRLETQKTQRMQSGNVKRKKKMG